MFNNIIPNCFPVIFEKYIMVKVDETHNISVLIATNNDGYCETEVYLNEN